MSQKTRESTDKASVSRYNFKHLLSLKWFAPPWPDDSPVISGPFLSFSRLGQQHPWVSTHSPSPRFVTCTSSPHSLSGMYHSFPSSEPNGQRISGGVSKALYYAEAARNWCESSFCSPHVVCIKAVSTHCPCLASFFTTVLGGQK